MPFELINAIKSTSGFSFASKGMNNIFVNKFYTSAILTIMILILIMIIYPCKKNAPSYILGKLCFYIFVSTIGIMFIHDCVMYNNWEKTNDDKNDDETFNVLNGGSSIMDSAEIVQVKHGGGVKHGGEEMVGFGECSGIGGNSNNEKESIGGDSDAVFALYGV
jgi:hypothetical protein